MSEFMNRMLRSEPGFERDLVDRYTERLLAYARRQLPEQLRRRVDPEDLVQSVYRSFFQRLKDGRFSFADSGDLWRLLAAMTFQRVTKVVRFHQQQCRDVRREQPLPASSEAGRRAADRPEFADHQPGPADLAALFDSLDRLLDQLPEKYHEIAVLQLQGFSIDEIAARVKRSRRTVFRALGELEAWAVKLLGASA